MVEQALSNLQWVRDIRGGLSVTYLIEYLELWDALLNFYLTDMDDRHLWRDDSSGCFSSKSAIRQFFNGSVTFEPWRRPWKSWAPPKCKSFLWLAIKDKCWTAYQLRKRAFPIPPNVCFVINCDQADEIGQHILVGVFLQENSSLGCCLSLIYSVLLHEENFALWWRRATRRVAETNKKGFNKLVILGA